MNALLRPTPELVAAAWAREETGLAAGTYGPTLPRDTASWADTGFVMLSAVDGVPDMYTPARMTLVQVDAYATTPATSNKLPWNRAAELAERVLAATDVRRQRYGRAVGVRTGYRGVRLQSAVAQSDPRRMEDGSGFARISFDIALHWVPVDQ